MPLEATGTVATDELAKQSETRAPTIVSHRADPRRILGVAKLLLSEKQAWSSARSARQSST